MYHFKLSLNNHFSANEWKMIELALLPKDIEIALDSLHKCSEKNSHKREQVQRKSEWFFKQMFSFGDKHFNLWLEENENILLHRNNITFKTTCLFNRFVSASKIMNFYVLCFEFRFVIYDPR